MAAPVRAGISHLAHRNSTQEALDQVRPEGAVATAPQQAPLAGWLRRLGLVVLAMVGATLLAFIATTYWGTPSDEHAYWLAGQRLIAGANLYDPAAIGNTPFAYWYPPIVAQAIAPVTAVLPSAVFSAAWIGLLLACLGWLSGRRPLIA